MRGKMLHAANVYESVIAVQLLGNLFFPFCFSFSFHFHILRSFTFVIYCLSMPLWNPYPYFDIFNAMEIPLRRHVESAHAGLKLLPEFYWIRCDKDWKEIKILWFFSRGIHKMKTSLGDVPRIAGDWCQVLLALHFSPLAYTSTLSWWWGRGTS